MRFSLCTYGRVGIVIAWALHANRYYRFESLQRLEGNYCGQKECYSMYPCNMHMYVCLSLYVYNKQTCVVVFLFLPPGPALWPCHTVAYERNVRVAYEMFTHTLVYANIR